MRKGEKASPARIGARMPTMAQLQFQFFGTFKKADGWYIAHCPPLDVTTQGKTLAEAKRNLIEASELFIISCLERGTLDLALRELGFVGPIKGRIPAMPANAFSFPVPIPLRFQRRSAAAECLAGLHFHGIGWYVFLNNWATRWQDKKA